MSYFFIVVERYHDQGNLKKHLFEGLLRVSESESITIMVEEGRHSAGAIDESLHMIYKQEKHMHMYSHAFTGTHTQIHIHTEGIQGW